jgi:hypothetical protein
VNLSSSAWEESNVGTAGAAALSLREARERVVKAVVELAHNMGVGLKNRPDSSEIESVGSELERLVLRETGVLNEAAEDIMALAGRVSELQRLIDGEEPVKAAR